MIHKHTGRKLTHCQRKQHSNTMTGTTRVISTHTGVIGSIIETFRLWKLQSMESVNICISSLDQTELQLLQSNLNVNFLFVSSQQKNSIPSVTADSWLACEVHRAASDFTATHVSNEAVQHGRITPGKLLVSVWVRQACRKLLSRNSEHSGSSW